VTRPKEAPVDLAPYDRAWPGLFEQERTALAGAIGEWLAGPIEHIGSTAVPGAIAKPVIDIMAGVRTLDDSRPAIAALASLGYCYAPYRPQSEHWFCKPSPAFRTHHLHLVPLDSIQWNEALAFRNFLRADPRVAAEYAALKERLARQFRFDREAYTEAKAPFIARIVRLALSEGVDHGHEAR
jgi:GrpB-like predicted nucleotidyltransferase (UPF0157 family)